MTQCMYDGSCTGTVMPRTDVQQDDEDKQPGGHVQEEPRRLQALPQRKEQQRQREAVLEKHQLKHLQRVRERHLTLKTYFIT